MATKQAEQREIIEQLLGITLLSQKADLLKEKMRVAKQQLTEEKYIERNGKELKILNYKNFIKEFDS